MLYLYGQNAKARYLNGKWIVKSDKTTWRKLTVINAWLSFHTNHTMERFIIAVLTKGKPSYKRKNVTHP